jgi:uncharacterized membrane protein
LIDRDTLAGQMGAYLTGMAVTSAPWLLTTAVLLALRVASSLGGGAFGEAERVLTVIYGTTMVFSAPVVAVASRHAADRIYEKRLIAIAAPLRRTLAVTMLAGASAGGLLMLLLGEPASVGAPGIALAAVVAGEWLLLAVGGGLASPLRVLVAFAVGAPVSLVAALLLDRGAVAAGGALIGFGAGQLLTLGLLLRATFEALPAETDESSRILPAFREHRVLAGAALAYHLAIWADKLVVLVLVGAGAAAAQARIASLAWFSIIPAFAWTYVEIETSFYQRFRSFFDSIERGASLRQLEDGARDLGREVTRILRGAAFVQLTVTLFVLVAAPRLLRLAGLPASSTLGLQLFCVGAGLQALTLLALLFLYYFDLQRDALVVGATLLGADLALSSAALLLGLDASAGYLLACGLATALAMTRVRHGVSSVLVNTFQSQPY